MAVVSSHFGVFEGHFIDCALPQRTGVRENVHLVDEGEALVSLHCALKSVSDNPFYTEACVEGGFGSDFCGSSHPNSATVTAVESFSSLADNNEVEGGIASKRRLHPCV